MREEQHNGSDNERSPARLEHEIGQTRAAMDETLDEIGRRLEPHQLMDQAWMSIREHLPDGKTAGRAARDAGKTIGRQVAEHPIPTALLGIGALWLLAESARGDGVSTSDIGARGREAASSAGRSVASATHSIAEESRLRGRNMARHASEAGHRMAGSAADIGHRVADSAVQAGSRVANTAARSAEHAAHTTAQAYDSRPLLFGGLIAAAGFAAGMMIPNSGFERRVLGKAGENLRREAADLGEHAVERVTESARDTVTEGTERARSAMNT